MEIFNLKDVGKSCVIASALKLTLHFPVNSCIQTDEKRGRLSERIWRLTTCPTDVGRDRDLWSVYRGILCGQLGSKEEACLVEGKWEAFMDEVEVRNKMQKTITVE